MGDRHGGYFARRGRALSPPRPHVDAHRAVIFRCRAVDFRWRGAGCRICPAQERSLGEGLQTRRTSERIYPARERSPRRRPPDTARRRKDLPRAGTRPSAKASRHGARAKEFAPRRNAPHGEGLPTRRTGERICPRENAPHGEGLPTRRTGERICPAGFAFVPRADERRAALGPQTAEKHPFGGVAPTARAATAEFIHRKKIRLLHETQLFYGESHVGSPQIFPSVPSVGRCVARERNPVPPVAPHRGSEPRGLRRTGKMVRRFDAMCPRGGEWLPCGGNGWPCGGRCDPGLRCFGERFHRRRCANPDACRGRRCSRG